MKLFALVACMFLSAACWRRAPLPPSAFARDLPLIDGLEYASSAIAGVEMGGSQLRSSTNTSGTGMGTITGRTIVASLHCPAEKRGEFVRALAQFFRDEIEAAGGFLKEIPRGAVVRDGAWFDLEYGIKPDGAAGKISVRFSDEDAGDSRFSHRVVLVFHESVEH